jgi:hypothetical protein
MEKNLQDHPLHHKIIKISLFLGSSLLNAPMSGKIQFKFFMLFSWSSCYRSLSPEFINERDRFFPLLPKIEERDISFHRNHIYIPLINAFHATFYQL